MQASSKLRCNELAAKLGSLTSTYICDCPPLPNQFVVQLEVHLCLRHEHALSYCIASHFWTVLHTQNHACKLLAAFDNAKAVTSYVAHLRGLGSVLK